MDGSIKRRDLIKSGALLGGAMAIPGLLSEALGLTRAEADVVNLTYLMAGAIDTLHLMQKVDNVFNREHPGIVATAQVVPWANYDQRVDLLVAAGTPPAVWFPGANRPYRYYASRNLVPSIDAEIAQSHYDLSDFFKPLIDFCKWRGHYVALPADWFGSILIYNKTMFDKAGLPHPPAGWNDRSWDYDKFLQYARALTVRKGGKTLQWGLDSPITDTRFPYWIFGGDIFAPQAYVTGFPTPQQITLNTPEVVDGLQFQQDLVLKWKVQPTPAEAQAVQAGAPSLFQTGKIGMHATATWDFTGFQAIKNFEWGVAALPWPPRRYGLPRNAPLYPDQWMVLKGQKHPKEAWVLQSWLAGPEGARLYALGIGGLPARKSVMGLARKQYQAYNPRMSAAEVDSAMNSVKYCRVSTSHAMVNWPIIDDQAITPVYQKLMLGHLTGKQAVAEMTRLLRPLLKPSSR